MHAAWNLQPFPLVMSDLTTFDLPLGPVAADARYASRQVLADRYELTRIIGHGGTAVVWVARDSVLDIDVAVKIVLPGRSDLQSGIGARTIREARLCAQLTEPAVCRVLDFGCTARGDPFVVSELLRGETLDDHMVREGRIAAIDAVRLMLPILDGLGAAHHKGIVHRDVKPANVFIARSDGKLQPKLLDFGIACSVDVRTTGAGTIWGTPCYMSPEQARGSGDIDSRSDLWSFCVVLYEMISGSAPFLNDDCNATLLAIANQAVPSLTSFGCDAALARIVARGLEKERDKRWPSAAALANALSHWLADRGVESDVCGISLRTRFLERTQAAAVPVLHDVAHDVASEVAVTLVPQHRQRWAGAVALFSTIAAAAVVSAVAISTRKSVVSVRTDGGPAAVTPAARPLPEPPLPIFEAVRTDVTIPRPPREEVPSDAVVAPSARPETVAAPRMRSATRRPPRADLLEPFLPESPFSRSRPPPIKAGSEPPHAMPTPAKSSAGSRVRTGNAPRRDYGI
jgi:eukaryotic-like serine/threonine-protein kinase